MTIKLTEQPSITWSTEETTLEDQTLLFVRQFSRLVAAYFLTVPLVNIFFDWKEDTEQLHSTGTHQWFKVNAENKSISEKKSTSHAWI